MTLIKCPHCGHGVLSVASKCPTCSGDLGPTFLGPEHTGELTECRSCGRAVRSRSRSCPQCGTVNPARQATVLRPMLGLVVVVLLGIIMVDQWPKLSANTEPAIRVVEAAPVAVAVAAPDTARSVSVDSVKPAEAAAGTMKAPDTTKAPDTKPPEPPAPNPVPPPAPVAAPAVAPVAEVASVERADTSTTRRTRWTRLWVNVRNAPEEGAPIARVLKPGTRVEGEERRYGWWVVYVEGDSAGYVAGALLSSRAPTERASN